MIPRRLLCLALVLGCVLGCGGTAHDEAAPAGLRSLTFRDEARGREIPVDLWYPAEERSVAASLTLAGIYLARGTRE